MLKQQGKQGKCPRAVSFSRKNCVTSPPTPLLRGEGGRIPHKKSLGDLTPSNSPFRIKTFFLFPLLVGEGRERWEGGWGVRS